MTLESKFIFVWQDRSIKDSLNSDNPYKTMNKIFEEYKKVTELYGSGKTLKKDYTVFMENKWAEVYRRIFGLDTQFKKYKVDVKNEFLL